MFHLSPFYLSPRLCPSTAGCSLPSMISIVLCCFPVPGGSLLPAIFCLVVPLISSFSLVGTLCSVWSTYHPSFLLYPAHLLFCFSVHSVMPLSLFFSLSLSTVSYLVALDLTFSSPLFFERFSVCFSIVY